MNRDDKIQSGCDGTKASDENSRRHGQNMSVGIGAGIGGVKCPAGIHAAGDDRPERRCATGDKKIPTHQIEPGKGDVPRADHQRHQKIAEHCWDRRD